MQLNAQELNLLLKGYDALLDYMESIDDEKLALLADIYNSAFDSREALRLQEVEVWRTHLENPLALSGSRSVVLSS